MLLLRTSRGVDPGIPLLRSLGSNAHVWLPGANGVSVASLPSNNYLLSDGSTGYSTVDGVDGLVKDAMDPVTGINLTQATTANKPLVRRGMLNELLNSATPATQSVTCIAAPYTLALYGTGNVVLSGTGAGTLTGTGASDLVVLNFTPTAGSVTFTKSGTVSSFGLFKGTWTAAKILAEGGIQTTTATAASNTAAGKYWWSYDGSNDCLTTASVPFQITDDHSVTIAARRDSITAVNALFDITNSGGGLPHIALMQGSAGSSVFAVYWVDNAGVTVTLSSTLAAGEVAVFTARQVGNVRVLRKNGVQVATNTTVLGAATVDLTTVGAWPGTSRYWVGAMGWTVPLKATMSDADCLTVERIVAAQFPGMSTVDGDANSMLLEDGSGFLTMETEDLILME